MITGIVRSLCSAAANCSLPPVGRLAGQSGLLIWSMQHLWCPQPLCTASMHLPRLRWQDVSERSLNHRNTERGWLIFNMRRKSLSKLEITWWLNSASHSISLSLHCHVKVAFLWLLISPKASIWSPKGILRAMILRSPVMHHQSARTSSTCPTGTFHMTSHSVGGWPWTEVWSWCRYHCSTTRPRLSGLTTLSDCPYARASIILLRPSREWKAS